MAFELKPGTKEIDSIGSFSQRATNMLKQFAKNFLEGPGSSIGALKGINNSYGADLKRASDYLRDNTNTNKPAFKGIVKEKSQLPKTPAPRKDLGYVIDNLTGERISTTTILEKHKKSYGKKPMAKKKK